MSGLLGTPRGGEGSWLLLRLLGQVVLFWVIIFIAEVSYAGEISVLAPFEVESKLLSRNRIVNIVVKVAEAQDLDLLLLQSVKDGRVYDPAGRYEKNGVYYVHYSVSLRKGGNSLILDPIKRPINIKFIPLSSLLNLNLDQPGTYLFHRDEVIPTDCLGCHAEKPPIGVKVAEVGYGRFSPECYSCHKAKVSASEWKHSPAAALLCRSCHRSDLSQTKVAIPSGKVETVCFSCHVNSSKWTAMSHIHGPVGTGDCTICHDPHGSNSKFQLWTDGKAKLCVVCHEDKKKYASRGERQKLKIHGILSARGCVACHSPHATEHRFQLLGEINDLCVSCHVELEDAEDGHPVQNHPLKGVKDPLRPGTPFSCTSCHNPHGSQYSYLLHGEQRGGMICMKCHSGRPKKNRYGR
ncbi:MAG: cytochrome c3 family protein [Thermodesulfobacteriota bacterium]